MAAKKFAKVSDFVNTWTGDTSLIKDKNPDEIGQGHIDDILNQDVILHAYSSRSGEFGEFALCVCTLPEKENDVFTISCGGKVVVKKLTAIGAKGGFPCVGQFVKPEGKRYYDLI